MDYNVLIANSNTAFADGYYEAAWNYAEQVKSSEQVLCTCKACPFRFITQ